MIINYLTKAGCSFFWALYYIPSLRRQFPALVIEVNQESFVQIGLCKKAGDPVDTVTFLIHIQQSLNITY